MLDLSPFRLLARKALEEKDPAELRNLVDQMLVLLRVEQDDLKHEIEYRVSRYPGPPQQPGSLDSPAQGS